MNPSARIRRLEALQLQQRTSCQSSTSEKKKLVIWAHRHIRDQRQEQEVQYQKVTPPSEESQEVQKLEGREGSMVCTSLAQIQWIKIHWEPSVHRPYIPNRICNIFCEDILLQDLELQTSSNTRSYTLRHNMLLLLEVETSVTTITLFFGHRLITNVKLPKLHSKVIIYNA